MDSGYVDSRIQAELQPRTFSEREGDGEHLDDRWAATAFRRTDEAYHAVGVVACRGASR